MNYSDSDRTEEAMLMQTLETIKLCNGTGFSAIIFTPQGQMMLIRCEDLMSEFTQALTTHSEEYLEKLEKCKTKEDKEETRTLIKSKFRVITNLAQDN